MAQDGVMYQVPAKLSSEVNSEAEEAAVFVSPDGETYTSPALCTQTIRAALKEDRIYGRVKLMGKEVGYWLITTFSN